MDDKTHLFACEFVCEFITRKLQNRRLRHRTKAPSLRKKKFSPFANKSARSCGPSFRLPPVVGVETVGISIGTSFVGTLLSLNHHRDDDHHNRRAIIKKGIIDKILSFNSIAFCFKFTGRDVHFLLVTVTDHNVKNHSFAIQQDSITRINRTSCAAFSRLFL